MFIHSPKIYQDLNYTHDSLLGLPDKVTNKIASHCHKADLHCKVISEWPGLLVRWGERPAGSRPSFLFYHWFWWDSPFSNKVYYSSLTVWQCRLCLNPWHPMRVGVSQMGLTWHMKTQIIVVYGAVIGHFEYSISELIQEQTLIKEKMRRR